MVRTVTASTLLASAALAAPVPPPKPDLTSEQRATLAGIEADQAEAARAYHQKSEQYREAVGRGDPDTPREAFDAAVRDFAGRQRAAAERLTRLLEEIGNVSREERLRVSAKAGAAWLKAREPERALGFLAPVIRGANAPGCGWPPCRPRWTAT